MFIMSRDGWKLLSGLQPFKSKVIPPAKEPSRMAYNGESPDNALCPWHQYYNRETDPRYSTKQLTFTEEVNIYAPVQQQAA